MTARELDAAMTEDCGVVLARLRRERDELGGGALTAATIGAGLDWPGSSVEVTNRVLDALRGLEKEGVVTGDWSQTERELLWRCTRDGRARA